MTDALKEYFTPEELNCIQSTVDNWSGPKTNKSKNDLSLLLSIGSKCQELLHSNKHTQQN